jgi:hypothetical protein
MIYGSSMAIYFVDDLTERSGRAIENEWERDRCGRPAGSPLPNREIVHPAEVHTVIGRGVEDDHHRECIRPVLLQPSSGEPNRWRLDCITKRPVGRLQLDEEAVLADITLLEEMGDEVYPVVLGVGVQAPPQRDRSADELPARDGLEFVLFWPHVTHGLLCSVQRFVRRRRLTRSLQADG